MVKKIPLQNGMFALVDDEDYEFLNKFIWNAAQNTDNTIEVQRRISVKNTISLGRQILKIEDSKLCVIRIKNDGLDFRKENLQVIPKNLAVNLTKRSRRDTSSKYRGVVWNKDAKKWQATIAGKYLGIFSNEDDAALAWNEAALKKWGTLCFQNDIGSDNRIAGGLLEKSISSQKRSKKGRGRKKLEYRGVSAKGNGFCASVHKDKNTYYCGYYKTDIEAALAYDKKAKELFGDKAILNFPDEKE